MTLHSTSLRLLACSTLLLSTANAQWWWYGDNDNEDGNDGYRPPWWNGDQGSARYFLYSNTPTQRALIAHAVIASAVWVLLLPAGGILLRLNLRSPWVLRVHAGLQIVSYLLYIAAAGLGIWLVQQMSFSPYFSLWDDPHPALGLAILALAFFQPILGAVHHRIFKKRVANVKSDKPTQAPGRTIPGYMHLWLGRILLILGIINGGLGIRLASRTPFQSDTSTRNAAIIYGVVAGVVGLIYLLVVIRFEVKKTQRNQEARTHATERAAPGDVPPTYVQSQQSSQKTSDGAVRYT